jgi:hypothetical protein
MKYIYFDPVGRIHSMMWGLVDNPPERYRVIPPQTGWDRLVQIGAHNGVLYLHLRSMLRK